MNEKTALPVIITLSVRIYRLLLHLGPAAYRQEYEASTLQVFRQCCLDAHRQHGAAGVLRLWLPMFFEAITGMLAEQFALERMGYMLPVMRRSMVATFWAVVLFLFAYVAFGQTADPVAPFNAVGRMHPEIAFTHTLVAYSGEVALLALLLGGLPFLFAAVKQAMPGGPRSVVKRFAMRPKQARLLLGAALLITIGFLGFLLTTQYIFGPPACTPTNGCIAGQPPLLVVLSFAALTGGITAGVFVVLAIAASLSLAVSRSEFGTGMLRFALLPIGILALAMATATVATAIWTIRLWVDAPQFAASGSGLGDGQTAWVIAMIAAMALSTLVTAGAFASGLKANSLRAA